MQTLPLSQAHYKGMLQKEIGLQHQCFPFWHECGTPLGSQIICTEYERCLLVQQTGNNIVLSCIHLSWITCEPILCLYFVQYLSSYSLV